MQFLINILFIFKKINILSIFIFIFIFMQELVNLSRNKFYILWLIKLFYYFKN